MSRLPSIVLIALVAIVIGWVAWSGVQRLYVQPSAALDADLASARTMLAGFRTDLADADDVRDEIAMFVDRTLGGDLERVDHRVRSRLNRVAEQVGLGTPVVGTGSASQKQSPARQAFPRRGAWKELRDEVDVVELKAWVNGEGDLRSVVELVDRIEAEPWLKRIDQVQITPRQGGERFDVSVRLTTLFLPGREPEAPATLAYDSTRLARYAALVEMNPFRMPVEPPPPPPPPPAPVVEEPAPTPPPAFPWEAWQLTGVAQSRGGPEAWLRNRNTRESRQLAVGQSLDAAVLTAIDDDGAVFTIGDGAAAERFHVAVGKTMNERTPRPGAAATGDGG